MWIVIGAVVVTVSLAFFLLAVVAITTGHARPTGNARWDEIIDNTGRHLNGEGSVPRVLERFDRR